ncbi:hypothetical protein MMC18_004282 [Xylographa bjoerkii]|nr:hypothetical protein [Xylographa bjoerkii]
MKTLDVPGDKTPEEQSDLSTSKMNTTLSLEGLQTDEQRLVLDTVADIRKCGLESILSLPQLVVCGDQSAGKSSVLEALTEIPFPRNDNLCTRFATEIILRRATLDSLTIKVIPDDKRPLAEQEWIKAFNESISDFSELPVLMEKAMNLMGLSKSSTSTSNAPAFAKDVLSIEIEGPTRPQLTLVDLPGLIQTETKGVTKSDVEMVKEITHHYVSQPRTICLAVISATNDYANQGILTKVREVDPDGERTLGIITKPDRLPQGSGSENAFLSLARNEDIFFKLGWHVLKNRSFEEGSSSFLDRNASEESYFNRSNFKVLPKECVGIEALRIRLSQLLFEHVKRELPRLREDLDEALSESQSQLGLLGNRRATPDDCRAFMAQLSLEYYETCKAAVNGHYEGDYFDHKTDQTFSLSSPATIRRLRAAVQYMNTGFSNALRTSGHKYQIARKGVTTTEVAIPVSVPVEKETDDMPTISQPGKPTKLSSSKSLKWVEQVLVRTRGRELPGNFNPLVVGELFWEQSTNWQQLAADHVDKVAHVCTQFLKALLLAKAPKDIFSRLWASHIQDALKSRSEKAVQELKMLIEDIQNYPINYNHYYTDTIKKQRQDRQKEALAKSIADATTEGPVTYNALSKTHTSTTTIDTEQVIKQYSQHIDPDMERHSCEEALDCMLAIYKVSQKTFVANVTTQVVERHIVRGLEKIFSPLTVLSMKDAEVEAVASEPPSAKRKREFLGDRLEKLKKGQSIMRKVMGSAML